MKDTLRQSAERVQSWVEDHDYKGYEPFDGNASFLRGLTFGNWFLERVLQQPCCERHSMFVRFLAYARYPPRRVAATWRGVTWPC